MGLSVLERNSIIKVLLFMQKMLLLLFSLPVKPHGLQHTRPSCPSPSPEDAQGHVYCIGDAIQPFHPWMPFSQLRDFSSESAVHIR